MSMSTTKDTSVIPGATSASQTPAVDADPSQRPGVPMELDPPRPAGAAHWFEPERQRDPGNVLKRKGLAELTPVFGTSVPPRGLSGIMRRAAYEIPEHYTSHWFVLLLADRVDVLEDRIARALPIVLPIAAGVAALAMIPKRRHRRLRWLR
jgi:hypothetical protein